MREIEIGGRMIGLSHPCFIIAEAGVNHDGELARAHALIDAAAEAGADVVKFQSFVTEEIATRGAPKASYQQLTTNATESQFKMLKSLELGVDALAELANHCAARGIVFLSTPYDCPSVDLLDRLGVQGYKIASSDATNVPLLRFVASKGKPVILSTGMCDLGDVEVAANTLQQSGVGTFALLHCTSEYPAAPNEANLRAIATLRRTFNCPVGFSDHTPGIGVSTWAVAAGACIIEKHLTLDRTAPGPDHAASLEPAELAELVRTIRQVEVALGEASKRPTQSELGNRTVMRKSLVARRSIAAGEKFDAKALACKRPGNGLPPLYWDQIVGRRAACSISEDQVITFGSVVWE